MLKKALASFSKVNIKMKRTYVITGFSRYPYPALVQKSRQIISSLNGNECFAELSPLVDTVKIAIDDFEKTLQQTNSNEAIRQYRFSLILLLNDLATYVQNRSNNDIAVLQSSGYNYIVNEVNA